MAMKMAAQASSAPQDGLAGRLWQPNESRKLEARAIATALNPESLSASADWSEISSRT
jgi:hypothetical protein